MQSSSSMFWPRSRKNPLTYSHFARATLTLALVAMTATAAFAQRPTISLSVSPSMISNQGEDAIITLTASFPPTRELKVNFFVLGTALPGVDYQLVSPTNTPAIVRGPRQIIFPAGQASVDVMLHTLVHDTTPHQVDSTQFILQRGNNYRVGSPDHVRVTIENLK